MLFVILLFIILLLIISKMLPRQTCFMNSLSDPHACHLSRDQFSEHDVAGALKRFLRNMPEPLVKFELYQPLLHSAGLYPCFCRRTILSFWESRVLNFLLLSEIADDNLKLLKYKTLLSQLSGTSNYATLKKLLGHLRVVAENATENLMTVKNIAASFGSTLMSGTTTRAVSLSRKCISVLPIRLFFFSAD